MPSLTHLPTRTLTSRLVSVRSVKFYSERIFRTFHILLFIRAIARSILPFVLHVFVNFAFTSVQPQSLENIISSGCNLRSLCAFAENETFHPWAKLLIREAAIQRAARASSRFVIRFLIGRRSARARHAFLEIHAGRTAHSARSAHSTHSTRRVYFRSSESSS